MRTQSASRLSLKFKAVVAGALLVSGLGGCETGRSLVTMPFDVAKFVAVKMVEIPYDAAKMTAQGTYDAVAQMGR